MSGNLVIAMRYQQQERRNATRASHTCKVEWWARGSTAELGEITALSTIGAYIATANPCLKGCFISVRFRLGFLIIETQGEVVHRTMGTGGMGVKFLNLTAEQYTAIERITRTEISHDEQWKSFDHFQ
jgi:hypothetical protein